MANQEQLNRLKQGVEAWNQWRDSCGREVKNDLSGADLGGENLTEADLGGVDFSEANLSKADLSNTFLSEANFCRADLSEVILYNAYLYEANLSKADLRDSDLTEANFTEANLSKVDLRQAYLTGADLTRADLTGANLRGADLSRIQGLGTDLTGAILTGACIEDWNINSQTKLDQVKCDYVYLKEDNQERRPSDPNRNFAPGEFTKLFQKALETVDLIFADGIDWKAFFQSFQELQQQYANENLSIQAIEKKSDRAFVIRLEVPAEIDKAEVERKAMEKYETRLQLLEAQYRTELQAKNNEIELHRQQNTDLMEIARLLASRPINVEATATAESRSMAERNINTGGGNYNETINTGGGNYIQGNHITMSQDLTQAAAQIQELLTQLQEHWRTC